MSLTNAEFLLLLDAMALSVGLHLYKTEGHTPASLNLEKEVYHKLCDFHRALTSNSSDDCFRDVRINSEVEILDLSEVSCVL